MPKVEIVGQKTVEVETGTRLVLAIAGAGVDIGHRCGGWAGCTTCRVEFESGEPQRMTKAEKEKLEKAGIEGARLACQIQVQGDMRLKVLMRASEQGWSDAGPEPEADITPDAEWVEG